MHIVVAWNFFVTTVDSASGGKGKGLTCKLSRDLEIFVHFVIVYLYICVFVYFCICVSLQKKREGLTCKLSRNLEICVQGSQFMPTLLLHSFQSCFTTLQNSLSLSYLFADDPNVFLHFWCRNALFLGHWAARK